MIHAYLRRLHCDEETDEVGADEPYVLATAVNLAATASATGRPVPVPAFEVVRYGPFDDVDEDETHGAPGPAQSFWGLIGGRWLEMGREAFGYPITDEEATADGRGRFNHFQALQLDGKPIASIHWHPDTGAHATFGAIRAKWAEMGWEESRLGYPVAGEEDRDGGRSQRFQGGALFWTAQGGVVVQ